MIKKTAILRLCPGHAILQKSKIHRNNFKLNIDFEASYLPY